MLNLEKVTTALEKGGIKFDKSILKSTQDICIEFVNKAGTKISMLFDSSKSINPIMESSIKSSNGDCIKRSFSINPLSKKILNVSEDKYVGNNLEQISDRFTTFNGDAVKGGKVLETKINIIKKIDGAWVPESKTMDFSPLQSTYTGSTKSTMVPMYFGN